MAPQNYVINIFETNEKMYGKLKILENWNWKRMCCKYNYGVTRKWDCTLKVIWNPVPQKLDNQLKGIHNLVPNGTWKH